MANNFTQYYAPQIVGDALKISGYSIGICLLSGVRKNLTIRGQERRGDRDVEQSRELLQKNFTLIPPRMQKAILEQYRDVQGMKGKPENYGGPKFRKFLQARDYRRLSKDTYKTIKNASDKAIDDTFEAQVADTLRKPRGEPEDNFGTASTQSNPFTDSHAISTRTDAAVSEVDIVEMTTFESSPTGEAGVATGFIRADSEDQRVDQSPPEVDRQTRIRKLEVSSHPQPFTNETVAAIERQYLLTYSSIVRGTRGEVKSGQTAQCGVVMLGLDKRGFRREKMGPRRGGWKVILEGVPSRLDAIVVLVRGHRRDTIGRSGGEVGGTACLRCTVCGRGLACTSAPAMPRNRLCQVFSPPGNGNQRSVALLEQQAVGECAVKIEQVATTIGMSRRTMTWEDNANAKTPAQERQDGVAGFYETPLAAPGVPLLV
ncbi:hypothetical protein F5148DRAFT_1150649 [Russula earlei]|uniref:Uncharacterized protein n=1 Tax=Russula earlei TaxID=71964 RepID=A0ACC0U3C6_9AGAM|nr:hypothetical protein F5148DRAFT_1150649 [Russula earlei]